MLSYPEMYAIAAEYSDHATAVDEFCPSLIDGLLHTPPSAAALEIGLLRGGSAIFILWHLVVEGQGRRLITVDKSFEPNDQKLQHLVWLLGRHPWSHWEMDQTKWIERTLPTSGIAPLGFVHHDGAHGDERVLRDVTGLAPYMASGATLAIDDAHECTADTLNFTRLGLQRIREYVPRQCGCKGIAFYRKAPHDE